MSDFRQTLNLKEAVQPKRTAVSDKSPLQTIERPQEKKYNSVLASRAIFIFFIILIAVSAYYFLPSSAEKGDSGWRAIKLVNGEIFYGQVKDASADPVILKNVYYNYDQNGKEAPENGNLRLVKRGKETYGPDGSMNIFRAQILYTEPLKDDSKVLEAILNYESTK